MPFRHHFETMFSPSHPQEICTYMGDLKIVPTTTATTRTTLSSPQIRAAPQMKARQRKGDDLSLFCGTRRSPTRPPIFFPPPHSSSSYSLRAPISPSRALPRFAQIDFNKLFFKKNIMYELANKLLHICYIYEPVCTVSANYAL